MADATIAPPGLMTIADFIRLYDTEGPFEIIDGEKIPMQATVNRHNLTVKRLFSALLDYEEQTQNGETYVEATFVLTERTEWVKGARTPDVMYVLADKLAAFRAEYADWEDKPLILVPDLVVEVMSANDLIPDVYAKMTTYLRDGVRLVWIIDPQKRTVLSQPHDDTPAVLREGDTLTGGAVLPGFEMAVSALFG